MNANFKAKFLQNFVSKKKGNEGFTLIELLVVIIIVGVLAAIALPSFLNQIGKARGSEAKANIGTINRSQQAFRLENNTFAGALTNLDAKVSGKFYTYTLGAGSATDASVGATLTAVASDLKTYSGAVKQSAGDVFGQVICESTIINGAIPGPTAPQAAVGTVAAVASACTNGSVIQ
jgi:type IV pilus assembly protein PilA